MMRRDLSRLSTSLKLFIRHPYSRSSKASNPRLPRWWWDRQRSRQEGGLQVCSGDVEHAEHDGAFRIDNLLSGVISVRLRNKGLRKNVQAENPARTMLRKCVRSNVQENEAFRIGPCSEGGLGLFHSRLTVPSTITHLSYLMFRLSWVPSNGTLSFLGASDSRALG